MGKNDDNNTNLAALGMALGTMGMNSGRLSLSEKKRDADKSCAKALAHMAETMDALNNLVKSIQHLEKQDEFDYKNIVELTGKMATLATSMSTLRMSIGLGAAPSIPGGYPTAKRRLSNGQDRDRSNPTGAEPAGGSRVTPDDDQARAAAHRADQAENEARTGAGHGH